MQRTNNLFWIIHFNPRTHEECDSSMRSSVSLVLYFNPRTHEECDCRPRLWRCPRSDFNPRTHEECDTVEQITAQQEMISIHALTRSATLGNNSNRYHWCYFNPRTHEECDEFIYIRLFHSLYFNPRTHEECDHGVFYNATVLCVISIHALTRSATANYSDNQ